MNARTCAHKNMDFIEATLPMPLCSLKSHNLANENVSSRYATPSLQLLFKTLFKLILLSVRQ